jgi:phospholipid/cholesterol/gamma-HCH transport system substrate-binding protein
MSASSPMKTLGSTIKFAIFTVVTLLATALLANTIANTDSRPTTSYGAIFVDAVNLNAGDEVRLAGVRVGSVSAVKLYDGTKAKVTFGVDRAVPLSTTTQAVIRYRNLIGQRYLAIVDGPTSGEPLRAGAVIPLDRTQPALNLNTLFNGFRPLLAGLEPGDVNQLSYELIRVLQGEGGTVNALFSHVASLSGTLADRDALIGQVIANLNAVLGPLDSRDQQLSSLITHLQGFVSGLSADREAISSSLVSMNELTGTTASLLQKARPDLKDDITQLGLLAAGLDEPESRKLLEHFLVATPFKLKVSTPEASYGAFLNFYVCAANFILPDGTMTPFHLNDTKRCTG